MLTLEVMLVFGGAAFILLPRTATNATFFGQLDKIYNDLNVFSSDKTRQEGSCFSQGTCNLPSYKKKNFNASNEISSAEANFTASTYVATEVHKTNSPIKSNSDNTKPIYSYIYNQISATSYASNTRIVFPTTNESHSGTNINPKSNEIQSIGIFADKNQTITNNSNNSFLANNTLSITTDLSDNNSPMMIDGGSNPGDPGVPVGDGTWVLLIMMMVYSFKGLRSFKSTISSKGNN